MTSAELPWSTRTLCTFLPAVTTEMTTGSLSCGTMSRRSPLVNTRSDSHGSPEILSSIALTPLAYFFRRKILQLWYGPRREPASRVLVLPPAAARWRSLWAPRHNPSKTRFSPGHRAGNPTTGSYQCGDRKLRGIHTKSLSEAPTPYRASLVASISQLYWARRSGP